DVALLHARLDHFPRGGVAGRVRICGRDRTTRCNFVTAAERERPSEHVGEELNELGGRRAATAYDDLATQPRGGEALACGVRERLAHRAHDVGRGRLEREAMKLGARGTVRERSAFARGGQVWQRGDPVRAGWAPDEQTPQL